MSGVAAESRSRDLQGQNRVRRADASGLMDAFATPFGADIGTMPGIQLHATWPTTCHRTASSGLRRLEPAWQMSARGSSIGCLAAFLPFTPAARERCSSSAAGRGSRSSFKSGLWLDMTQPLGAMRSRSFRDRPTSTSSRARRSESREGCSVDTLSRDVYRADGNPDSRSLAASGGK